MRGKGKQVNIAPFHPVAVNQHVVQCYYCNMYSSTPTEERERAESVMTASYTHFEKSRKEGKISEVKEQR